jgi:hypothetical protein
LIEHIACKGNVECIRNLFGKPHERNQFGNGGVDGKIKLKWILKT